MKNEKTYRFLFAGGGTGGHLFPAIAVAEKILELKPQAEILFVGTKNKIEGTVVPKLGYKFKSIWIKGFARKLTFENLLFPLKLIVSLLQSIFINVKFNPKVAIGSGGYVSGPAIWGASVLGAKIILLEQNSYPGITTRLLEKYANEIHLSFDDAKKYLRKNELIRVSGNPIRSSIKLKDKSEAIKFFGLDSSKKTLLVLGGSLGAKSLNEAIAYSLSKLNEMNIQVIWQTGKNYISEYKKYSSDKNYVAAFIDDMSAAYSACDLMLARAGATTIAEITSIGISAVLVPSPNVTDNHQYHNAKSLEDRNAAIMIEDKKLNERIISVVSENIFDINKLLELKNNAKRLGKPDAAEIIAKRAIELAEGKE
ncbi:MAG: undecaprenyldiphospho-muramoylpentapeptide beta-N-acetylglucosaminyltransferase [Chlorobiaceae bacterium]|nr:undecaprenyldiphospho-muramoylpentapeptide beta-N-acetylglucosaminyltransferase [Chlorobiaceae bacterium]MBA4309674.1 undecaprenyldiphospho-muramoylpentapeptide beta-N-acetylglucosaminyltransferase [Chlorobiaceae bacterium]